MKKLAVTVACLVGGLSAFGQGFVSLANLGTGVNSPFKDSSGVALSGSGYTVQLLTGATPTSVADSIAPFFTGSFLAGGYFNAGSRTVPAADVFAWPASPNPQALNGTYAILQVWSNLGGTVTSYNQALTTAGAQYGKTVAWEIPVQISSTLPAADMAGMPLINGNGNLILVPEPSTIALGILGVAVFLLGRRK